MPSITMSIRQAFELAVEHHRSGRLAEAKQIYRQILAQEPDDPDALQLLGLIAHDEGRHDEAVDLIGRAVSLNPAVAEYQSNFGVALSAAGRVDEAIAAYRAAVGLDAEYVDAYFNLGNALKDKQRYEEAVAAYREALRLKPDMAEAHLNMGAGLHDLGLLNEATIAFQKAICIAPDFAEAHYALGNSLRKLKRRDEAVAAYEESIRFQPGHHDSHNNLANVLREQGKFEAAEASYRDALRLKPDSPAIRVNLGNVLTDLWRLEEAEASFRQVIASRPDHADALNSLGNALNLAGRLDEAITCYRRAMSLSPEIAVFHLNMGNALRTQGKLDESLASYEQALALQPDFPGARFNRSLAWLLKGEFELAWNEYEWRWEHRSDRPAFTQPSWDGSPLGGRTILLYTEQGLGDSVQFIRFARVAQESGGRVLVRCQRPLIRLLSTCAGIDVLLAEDDPLPRYDVHFPLMSLPTVFKTIPAAVPYLKAEAELVEVWRRKLGSIREFKVGIAWQGNPKYGLDPLRSMKLAEFAPLAQIPGVRLFSLQAGLGTEQLAELGNRFSVVDLRGSMNATADAFVEDAAAMMNLDLLICSDSAVAHVAAALGRPVWLALPYAPDWRWLLGREDSPWYPTMRIFTQESWGDWAGVFARIAAALKQHLGASVRERSGDAFDHDVHPTGV
jgi:tetratricopeptide (TPR) repeat protein